MYISQVSELLLYLGLCGAGIEVRYRRHENPLFYNLLQCNRLNLIIVLSNQIENIAEHNGVRGCDDASVDVFGVGK